ncbi:TPA: hypothetical protein QH252_004344 [Klebsiella aerogenes]|uniref:hypothetical protein n=1 Tax=Klebsiella aerogenes TaxID=548 RepID=UPI00092217FE|nr:hypothetical protein [Klebsiella aerogenes]EIV3800693.1 hypothetical protein [Klebsiella aerogenes]EIV7212234.1 hypothetical protein [Klebsiella aerogenes]EKZ5299560.1 hypothetical protein [Klebsiella aerogenes]SFX49916.1 hypothetical protein SAMN03097705_3327 [[Enterobacter] aerogenes] [Klebsiella aerogenes]HDS6526519.1 hypothetical protein [Klebsiella aerogenes]
MTERGMIFNGEMVRAILNGRKTQTRRIVNWHGLNEGLNLKFSGLKAREYPNGWVIESDSRSSSEWRCKPTLCPFGSVGDRIWVRETFSCIGNEDGHPVDAKGNLCTREEAQRIYRASAIQKPNNYGLWSSPDGFDFEGAWTPSIHMPRWASRILLEITEVRVERLREISQADAEAEGVGKLKKGFWKNYQPGWTEFQLTARGSFATLWKSIYGDESWYADPWVWVIEFKRIEEVRGA